MFKKKDQVALAPGHLVSGADRKKLGRRAAEVAFPPPPACHYVLAMSAQGAGVPCALIGPRTGVERIRHFIAACTRNAFLWLAERNYTCMPRPADCHTS